MLIFEDAFRPDYYEPICYLWADDPTHGHVRFDINVSALRDLLGIKHNHVHDNENIAVCERQRVRIEAACRRALATRPGDRIELMPGDFA